MEPNETGGEVAVEITDQELFDHAVSDTPAAAEAPQAEAQTEEKSDRARDELGRFAKESGDRKLPPAEAEKVANQVVNEHLDSKAALQQPKAEDHRVPLRELLDERERRQQAAQELAQLRAWQQQVLQWQAQQARRQQQPQEPLNIFDNPDTYLAQRFVQPLQQWGQHGMMQVKDGLSREMANQQFTEQAVNDALAEMQRVRYTPEGTFSYQQIMNSGHPYGALVKWHQEQKMRQEIGNDPQAYRKRILDEAMKDPAFQAETLKLLRETQKGSGRPPVVSLPPSLSSQPSSGGPKSDEGDMSDRSLYEFATR